MADERSVVYSIKVDSSDADSNLSALSSAFERLSTGLSKPISLSVTETAFTKLSEGVSAVGGKVSTLDTAFANMAQAGEAAASNVASAMEEVEEAANGVGEQLSMFDAAFASMTQAGETAAANVSSAMENVGEAVVQQLSMFDAAFANMTQASETAANSVASTIDSVSGSAGNASEKVRKTGEEVNKLSSFFDKLGGIASKVMSGVSAVADKTKSAFDTVVKGYMNQTNAIGNKITATYDKLQSKFTTLGKMIKGEINPKLNNSERALKGMQYVLFRINPELGMMARSITGIFDSIAKGDLIGTAVNSAMVVVKGMVKGMRSAFAEISRMAEESRAALREGEGIAGRFNRLTGGSQKAQDFVESYAGITGMAISEVMDTYNEVSSFWQKAGVAQEEADGITASVTTMVVNLSRMSDLDSSNVFSMLTEYLNGANDALVDLGVTFKETDLDKEAIRIFKKPLDKLTELEQMEVRQSLAVSSLEHVDGLAASQNGQPSTTLIEAETKLEDIQKMIDETVAAAVAPYLIEAADRTAEVEMELSPQIVAQGEAAGKLQAGIDVARANAKEFFAPLGLAVSTTFMNAAANTVTGLNTLYTAAKEFPSNVSTWYNETYVPWTEAVASNIVGWYNDTYVPWTENVALSIVIGANNLLTTVGTRMGEWKTSAQEKIDEGLTAFNGWKSSFIARVSSGAIYMKNTASAWVGSKVTELELSAKAKIDEGLTKFNTWKDGFLADVQTGFSGVKESVLTTAESWKTNVETFFANPQEAFAEWSTNFVTNFDLWKDKYAKDVADKFDTVKGLVLTAGQTAFDGAMAFFEDPAGALSEWGSTVLAKFNTWKDTFFGDTTTGFGGLTDNITATVNRWTSEISALFESIRLTFSGVWRSLTGWASAVGQGVSHFLFGYDEGTVFYEDQQKLADNLTDSRLDVLTPEQRDMRSGLAFEVKRQAWSDFMERNEDAKSRYDYGSDIWGSAEDQAAFEDYLVGNQNKYLEALLQSYAFNAGTDDETRAFYGLDQVDLFRHAENEAAVEAATEQVDASTAAVIRNTGAAEELTVGMNEANDSAGSMAEVMGTAVGAITGLEKSAQGAAAALHGKSPLDGVTKPNGFGGGFASGTDDFAGGWLRMNEEGGELAYLPQGTAIVPSDKTDRILESGGGGDYSPIINITVQGSVDDNTLARVRDELEDMMRKVYNEMQARSTTRRSLVHAYA
jgi:hypothetical protein